MKLDFEFQLAVLNAVTEAFPQTPSEHFVAGLYEKYGKDHTNGNLMYLEMHGLVKLVHSPFLEDIQVIMQVIPTEKAFDYLSGNGGWSAAFGVPVVKLHEESVKSLIQHYINLSELPIEQKSAMAESVRKLPDTALQHLTTKLIDSALAQMPSILMSLQKFF